MGVCIPKQCSLVLPVFKLYVNESYQMDSCISRASYVQHYPYEIHPCFWGIATVHLPSLLYRAVLYLYVHGTTAYPLISLFIDGTGHVPSFKPL